MDTRRLKHFLTVAELGSISKAADALGIAQPALSAQMQQLEEAVGCQLLSRSSRGVVPTEAGKAFCHRAITTLKHAESLLSLGKEMRGAPSGHVVVGMPVSVGALLSVPLIKLAAQRFPDISLGIDESPSVQLDELLLRGKLDVSVLFSRNISKGIQSTLMVEEELFVVSVLGGIRHGDLRHIARKPMVIPAKPNSLRSVLDTACQKERIQLTVAAEVTSPHTMLQLALEGVGSAILPWSTIANTAESALPRARLQSPALTRTIAVAVATDAPMTPAVLAVKELLMETMNSLIQDGRWKGARVLRASHP